MTGVQTCALPILIQASSTDGLHFVADGTLVRDQASVPGAVVWGDELLVYMVDGSIPQDAGRTGMMVGTSTDGGSTFEFSDAVIEGAARACAYDPAALVVSWSDITGEAHWECGVSCETDDDCPDGTTCLFAYDGPYAICG